MMYLWVGTIGGFAVALVTIFFKTISPYTAPAYAVPRGWRSDPFPRSWNRIIRALPCKAPL